MRSRELNLEDMKNQLAIIDPNDEKKIKFQDYIKNIFEEIDDVQSLEDESIEDDAKELKKLYLIEKNMWTHLVGSVDKEMDYEIFYQLIYPHEFANLKSVNERLIFETYDADKNGYLSVDEFLEYSKDVDDTIINQKVKKFTKKIDFDADNQLNFSEFQIWNKQITPSLNEIINDEKNYLLNCCDENNDLNFSQVEVEKNCESFLQSFITNYSLDIKKESNERNLKEEL